MDQRNGHNAITRRLLLAGAATAIGSSAYAGLPVPSDNKLAFRLMRHGTPIGTHTMNFHRDGDALTVDIAVDVLVKFGPIPFVRYTHRNQETWRHDRLLGFVSQTYRNGTKMHVRWRVGSIPASRWTAVAPRHTSRRTMRWRRRIGIRACCVGR